MNSDREAVSVALFNLINGAVTAAMPGYFQTVDRTPRDVGDIPPANQPSLSVFKISEVAAQNQAYGATRYRLHYSVLCYARASSERTAIWETICNTILTAIDNAMVGPLKGQPNTLGGLVGNAWIEGQTLIDNGIIDQQMALLIPVIVETGI